jgi:hypothetical protein
MAGRECDPNYGGVYWTSGDDKQRIIVCKDDLQYIVQSKEGDRWRATSYHFYYDSIANRYPDLGAPTVDPKRLARDARRASGTAPVGPSTVQTGSGYPKAEMSL